MKTPNAVACLGGVPLKTGHSTKVTIFESGTLNGSVRNSDGLPLVLMIAVYHETKWQF